MNRGGNEPSTESACGGMYSKDVQDMCEDQVCIDGGCGTEAPAKINTRRDVRVNKMRKDRKKIRFKDSK